jgi:hypothetical protein
MTKDGEQSSRRIERRKACPGCGGHTYRSSYHGTAVLKCAIPISSCPLNRQWHEDHGGDEYRTPLGKTAAQVRRAYVELRGRYDG